MKEHYAELQKEMDDKHAAELREYNTLMETATNQTGDSDEVDKGNQKKTKKRKRKLGHKRKEGTGAKNKKSGK